MGPADADAAEFLHFVETTRDPTHVRSLTEAAWRGHLEETGLRVERLTVIPKGRTYRSWTDRVGMKEEAADALEAEILRASAPLLDRFFTVRDGRLDHFTDPKIVLLARR